MKIPYINATPLHGRPWQPHHCNCPLHRGLGTLAGVSRLLRHGHPELTAGQKELLDGIVRRALNGSGDQS